MDLCSLCFVGVSYMVGGDFRFLHLGVFPLKVDGVVGFCPYWVSRDVIGLRIFSVDDSDCESESTSVEFEEDRLKFYDDCDD